MNENNTVVMAQCGRGEMLITSRKPHRAPPRRKTSFLTDITEQRASFNFKANTKKLTTHHHLGVKIDGWLQKLISAFMFKALTQ